LVAFKAGDAVPNQSVVFAEEVKALIGGVADAQIADRDSAIDKEPLGKSDAFIATGDLFKIPMDEQ
jgi:hypothetical protein